jgi:hypothetical protein
VFAVSDFRRVVARPPMVDFNRDIRLILSIASCHGPKLSPGGAAARRYMSRSAN